jgi:predicted transposase/invertase (TIGR01784 family)
MTLVFNNNIPATELLLRIILGRKIQAISVDTQVEFRSPVVGGRDITLDIVAIDEDGQEVNIEVQGNSEGTHVRRARFHSGVIDSRLLKENDPFKVLKDSYVIFIYKHDKFGAGLPIYRIERVVQEIGKPFNDGSHIIYVNGNYKGNDDIGKLIEDFHAKTSAEMNFKELADGVHHFKETEGGRDIVCEKVREYAEKYAEKYAEEYAEEYATKRDFERVKNLMNNMKLTLEQALDALGIAGQERATFVQQLQK